MGYYQVKGGTHSQTLPDGTVKTWKTGEVVKTKLPLDEMFRNKFQKVGILPPVDIDAIDPDMESFKKERQTKRAREMMEGKLETNLDKKVSKKAKSAGTALAARGKNVTGEFENVLAEGLLVFKREKLFHVYTADSVKPINGEGLKRSKVEGFVKEFLES